MKKFLSIAFCLSAGFVMAQKKNMYQKGWIDFNKNGTKDVFEDPQQPVEKRVADLLSQMTLGRKILPDGHSLWLRSCAKR